MGGWMSACSLCCLFHCLVLCPVSLRCVSGFSCFVIGLIALFLYVDCFFLFVFFSFFALCTCFSTFLIVSLHLFCAACYLRQLFLFVEVSFCAVCPLLIVACLQEYLVSGCGALLCHWCITASHPHKARKFPHAGSESSPAALWEVFWTSFSLLLHITICPLLFLSETFPPLGHTQANSWLQMWFAKQFPPHPGLLHHCQMFK